jgi:hypothetical protein
MVFPVVSFLLTFPSNPILPMRVIRPDHLIILDLIILIYLAKSISCEAPHYFITVQFKYSPRLYNSQKHSVCYFFNSTDQALHSYQSTGRIKNFYILIFTLLDCRREFIVPSINRIQVGSNSLINQIFIFLSFPNI